MNRRRANTELRKLAKLAIAEKRLDDAAKIMYLVEFGYRLPRTIFLLELNFWRQIKRAS